MHPIDSKINELRELTDEFIYPEYYPHESTIIYKISNVYTNYGGEVFVLSPLHEGIEKALDLAIKHISQARNQFYNQ